MISKIKLLTLSFCKITIPGGNNNDFASLENAMAVVF